MNILLAVTGSVASKLTPKIAAAFNKLGDVKIIATKSALPFISYEPNALQEILTDQDELKWEKKGDSILHIDLRNWADVLVIAPLSANTLSKISIGAADNLVTCVARAWDYKKPMVLAPSMNTLMWDHPFTAKQLGILTELGASYVEPASKTMMCGETGVGALANIDAIVGQMLKVSQINTKSQFQPSVFIPTISKWQEVQIAALSKLIKNPATKASGLWKTYLEETLQAKIFGGFLEDRSPLFDTRHDPKATIHIGMDYWVDAGTNVHCPLQGEVTFSRGPRSTSGGWGGRLDIKTKRGIYIFGHLNTPTLVKGNKIEEHQIIGSIASTDTNGGWMPHLHVQVMTEQYYNSFSEPNSIDAYAVPSAELTKQYIAP